VPQCTGLRRRIDETENDWNQDMGSIPGRGSASVRIWAAGKRRYGKTLPFAVGEKRARLTLD